MLAVRLFRRPYQITGRQGCPTADGSNRIRSLLVKHASALLPVFISGPLWWFMMHLMLLSSGTCPTSPQQRAWEGRNAEEIPNICKKEEREDLRSR